jgi:hypothetical protein
MTHGKLTSQVAVALAQEFTPKGFDVLFDHAVKGTVPPQNLGKIASWFGPEYRSFTQLGFLDIAVVSRVSEKAIVLIEIEETTDQPKVLLGDLFATLLGEGVKFQGKRDLLVGPWTTLVILGRSKLQSHQARVAYLMEQAEQITTGLSTPNSSIGQTVIDLFRDEVDLLEKLRFQINQAITQSNLGTST